MEFVSEIWTRIRMVRDENGQGLAEYALILGLVAVVAVSAVTLLGTNITAVLNNIAGSLP